MFFNKAKAIEHLLFAENKRLKRENQQLRDSLDKLEGYKQEYKELIGTIHDLKARYQEKVDKFSQLENEYQKELNKLTDGNRIKNQAAKIN